MRVMSPGMPNAGMKMISMFDDRHKQVLARKCQSAHRYATERHILLGNRLHGHLTLHCIKRHRNGWQLAEQRGMG